MGDWKDILIVLLGTGGILNSFVKNWNNRKEKQSNSDISDKDKLLQRTDEELSYYKDEIAKKDEKLESYKNIIIQEAKSNAEFMTTFTEMMRSTQSNTKAIRYNFDNFMQVAHPF